MRMPGLRFATLAALLTVASGTVQAETCPAIGRSKQAEFISGRLSGGDGAGMRALGSFADGDTIFVLMPRGPALVIPPDIAAQHRGQIVTDAASILLFSASERIVASKSIPPPVWSLDKPRLIIVPQSTVTGIVGFAHRGRSYVFLAGESPHSVATCLTQDLKLLPSHAGLAIQAPPTVKASHIGSEAVVESGSVMLLVSPCCAKRPTATEFDPRRALDHETFVAHVEGDRFLGPGDWRVNWASAALDAHARLLDGDLDEARAAFSDIRRARGQHTAPAILLLHELSQIDRLAIGTPPLSSSGPTVREEKARLRTAHAVLDACRSRDFTALQAQRLSFTEVLPPSESLPSALAASLALCEAEYLLKIGEPRAAVARLRGRDAPTDGPAAIYRLVLDATALRRAGQLELAKFAAARLMDALDDIGGPPDLRPYETYLRTDVPLDPALVLRTLFERQRSFGDFRLDFWLLSTAIAAVDMEELVLRLDGIRTAAARTPNTALDFALRRVAVRRLIAALAAGEPATVNRPLVALDFVRRLLRSAEFKDLTHDLSLASADLALQAGLHREAGSLLSDTLASWPAGEPLEGQQRAWLKRLLQRYHALQALMIPSDSRADLWDRRLANDAVAALRKEVRHDLERQTVEAAVENDGSIPPGERRLLERLRKLRFDP